jgi:sigma-B regulation protein RsbU (phosphoserine phosphatase)
MKPALPIRWKLLILLLGISLIPLAASSFLQRQWMRRNGQLLAGKQREDLCRDARDILQYVVNDYTRELLRAHDVLDAIVRVQAREAERLMASPSPTMPGTVYFDTDFDEGRLPDDAVLSDDYAINVDGEKVPQYVSLGHLALMTFPGTDPAEVADDLARMAAMGPIYQELRSAWPDLIQWQYTSLESGIQSYYPGRGGNDDYDARQQAWYRKTVENDAMTVEQDIDTATGKYVITVSLPIHGPGGDIVGVTSVDVSLERLTDGLRLPARWREAAGDGGEATVLFAYQDEFTGVLGSFAEIDYYQGQRMVRYYNTFRPVLPDDPEARQQLRADLNASQANVISVQYDGQPALMAYGPIVADKAFPLIIVPEEVFDDMADQADEFVRSQFSRGLLITGTMLILATLIVIALALMTSRSISEPIGTLVQATSYLQNGNFAARVEINTRDELQELGEAFNAMVPQLEHRQQMAESLAVAREVQQHLLPHDLPALDGFDIHGGTRYCDETGGDYYDFIPIDPGRLIVALGDVAGHGIGPALLMASARSIIRARAEEFADDLKGLFDRLNVRLVRDTGDARFMTLFYGLLDSRDGRRRLLSISGGHDPALHLKADGTVAELALPGGMPLGIFEDAVYEPSAPLDLQAGEVILVGSDGIWEATNADGGMFGKQRLMDLLQASPGLSAQAIYQAVLDAVLDFIGQAPRTDDITLLVIRTL